MDKTVVNKISNRYTQLFWVYFKLSLIFITYRIIQYSLILLTPNEQFDTSILIFLQNFDPSIDYTLINQFWNRNLLNKLLSWDAIFFIKGITKDVLNCPEFEYELMFSRIWIQIIKSSLNVFGIHLKKENFYQILVFTLMIENLLHLFSVFIVYVLTLKLYSEHTYSNNKVKITNYSKNIAIIAASLFIFTSGSGFFVSIYSEPLSFFLTFIGILIRDICLEEIHSDKKYNGLRFKGGPFVIVYVVGTVSMFALATLNRSNCVLLGIFYIYDILQLSKHLLVTTNVPSSLFNTLKQIIFYPLLSGVVMLGLIIYNWYYLPFQQFCPLNGEWCNKPLLNSIDFITKESFYTFIQGKYWNVGFLNYWTVNNIPNFLLGFPQFIILIASIRYYIHQNIKARRRFTLQPLIVVTLLLVLLILFIAHVQIINRVSTFIPLHLWYMSEVIVSHHLQLSTSKEKDTNETRDSCDLFLVRLYIGWLFFWIPVQTVLFGMFLPPA